MINDQLEMERPRLREEVAPVGHPPAPARVFPWFFALLGAVAAGGVGLRLCQWAMFQGQGVDEVLYARYLDHLIKIGLGRYPDIVDHYMEVQAKLEGSILPPTRFLYIFCAYLWHGAFGGGLLASFHAVSRLFSVLTLAVAGGFAFRLLPGRGLALAALALFAFSPLQVHMAQHALADGFFEFWALLTLWALWENLRAPERRGWLAAYGLGLAAMVTTKENAFFVFVALGAVLLSNRWLRFGTVTRPLLAATLLGPLLGVAVLANIAGGLPELVAVYRLGVPKNLHLPYAIQTGDGPWFRYWLDLMIMSPVVFVLAAGRCFQLKREDRPLWFGLVFIAASYALMCNVRYGMNLRYATIWDFPLRALAAGQAALLAAQWGGARGRDWALGGMTAALCAFDVGQYYQLAVEYPLYELVPSYLLHALHILK